MKIVVTGATGFVGRAVCACHLERGHEVLALVRRPHSAPAGTTEILAPGGDLLNVPIAPLRHADAVICVFR